jgi:tetratricopeptide (TPR) repeat protein
MARLRWLPLCLMLTAGAPAGDAYSALMARAQAEFDVGHGTEAMALFGEAAKSAPDAHGEMIALYDVGVTANAMGQPQLAVAPLARALQMARQTGDAGLEEAALAKLADASFDAGDLPHTISAYGDLLARAEAAGNEATAAVAAERLGSAQLRSGKARAALPHLRRAAALYVKSGERVPQARVLLSLGTAADQADQYLEAADAFSRSAAISHELNDKADESRALNGQAVAVYHLGDFAASVTLGRKAVALASRALDRVAEDEARTSLGNAQGLQGNWQEAVKSYQQVLDDAHASGDQAREGEAAGNLGLAYMHLEDYGRAEGLLRQDIGIAHKRGATLVEAQALDDLGSMLAQRGRDADAIPVLEHSRDLASSVGASRSEALALRALGPAQMRTGRLAEAEGTLRRAVAIREALRAQASRDDRYNISLLDTGTEDYLRLQAVLVAENRPEAALEASDAARARALADKLALLAGEKLPAHQLTAGEIGAVAAETGVTLVEFSVLDEANRILIWVIRPDGSIVFRPLSVKGGSIGDIMDGLIHDTRTTLGAGPGPVPASDAGLALRDRRLDLLYHLLIAPIADLLPASPAATVVLIPEGRLFELPFAALRDASGHSFIEAHALATAPSVQVFGQLARRHDLPATAAFVAGDPAFGPIRLEPRGVEQTPPAIPQTAPEAKAVAGLLHTHALLGAAATKAAALAAMPGAGMIHLATHGFAQDVRGDGFPGALALAPDRDDDGLLTSTDVSLLSLRARLVVLSACDTGLGSISGDGVIGLSRAFLGAGARSIVVSLWTVPDAATAELMQVFYAALGRGRDTAQALRAAMLTTRTHHPDPLDWAGFILVGDSR